MPGDRNAERQLISAAADRLLAGTSDEPSGQLTVVALAHEAGVPRWVLTHRHPDLMRQFQARAKTQGRRSTALRKADDQLVDLASTNARLRADNRRLTALVTRYAVVINELAGRIDDQARNQRDPGEPAVRALRGGG